MVAGGSRSSGLRGLAAVLGVFIMLPAAADTLGDLRAAVGRLAAKQAVRGTFAVDVAMKAAGKFSNQNTARKVALEVTHDGAGVSLTIPQALLDRKAVEAINLIHPRDVADALDFREPLLTMMEGATVTAEQRVAHQGRPARLLVLKLKPRDEKESNTIRIGSSKTEEQLSIWIGDDNLPLAGERTQKTTAGFMFFHGTTEGRTSYTFAHTADRLLLARMEEKETGSGMGQKVDVTSVQTLTLH